MDRKLNLKKGDKCIMAMTSSNFRSRNIKMTLDNIKEWTIECEVISIGRRYVTVKEGRSEYKFDIDNNYREKSNYSPDYILYQNIQEIFDERDADDLNEYIRNRIGQYGSARFSLEKLKRIKEIIDEE